MNTINFLQSFQTDWLTIFFKFITFFGNEEFYILILPLFFWLWDKEKALKLFFILLPSLLFNFYIKEIFQTARPVGVALIEQGGFAFPSGHAQGTITLWLMLALLVRKKWMYVLATVMIILVPLSRLYLGVHWPIDIIGGLLFGAFLVIFYEIYWYTALKEYLSAKTNMNQAALLTLVILLFVMIYPVSDAITVLAVIWGFGLVLIFTDVINTAPRDGIVWKILILLVGVIGVLLVWKGLKILLPANGLARFIRYSLIGVWTAYLPFLMRKRIA